MSLVHGLPAEPGFFGSSDLLEHRRSSGWLIKRPTTYTCLQAAKPFKTAIPLTVHKGDLMRLARAA